MVNHVRSAAEVAISIKVMPAQKVAYEECQCKYADYPFYYPLFDVAVLLNRPGSCASLFGAPARNYGS